MRAKAGEEKRKMSLCCQAGQHQTGLLLAPVSTISGLTVVRGEKEEKKSINMCGLKAGTLGDRRQCQAQVCLPTFGTNAALLARDPARRRDRRIRSALKWYA